ncbi:hypothetical protein [Flavobacterium sp.]
MKAKILEIAKLKHISSGGSCGTYFVDFIRTLKVTAAEFEEVITEMYNDEQIQIRPSINGFLVMHKTQSK